MATLSFAGHVGQGRCYVKPRQNTYMSTSSPEVILIIEPRLCNSITRLREVQRQPIQLRHRHDQQRHTPYMNTTVQSTASPFPFDSSQWLARQAAFCTIAFVAYKPHQAVVTVRQANSRAHMHPHTVHHTLCTTHCTTHCAPHTIMKDDVRMTTFKSNHQLRHEIANERQLRRTDMRTFDLPFFTEYL